MTTENWRENGGTPLWYFYRADAFRHLTVDEIAAKLAEEAERKAGVHVTCLLDAEEISGYVIFTELLSAQEILAVVSKLPFVENARDAKISNIMPYSHLYKEQFVRGMAHIIGAHLKDITPSA